MDHVLVTGAGGFIGGHLVRRLREDGVGRIRAVDCKPKDEWYQVFDDVENVHADLQLLDVCRDATDGVDTVFNLAADMGGMGFIENNKALCMLSVLVSTHVLVAAREAGVERLFYSSSACVYAAEKQVSPEVVPLAEPDAYPAMPEDGYGWEKLFSERMARHFLEDFGIETRVARYHNVYGPEGTWDGGREKAPAAICRKVATAALTGDHRIEIWGDGEQTRSFTYIDDCLEGTLRLTASDVSEPLNIGSDQLVTINQLVDIVEGIAGIDARAQLQARRAAGRARPQQRQHADPRASRLGPVDQPRGRPRGHLRLGARPGGGHRQRAEARAVSAGVNRRRALVLADQAASSLSNVVVAVLVARSFPDETEPFAAFALAIMVFQFTVGSVRGLIFEPELTLHGDRDSAEARAVMPGYVSATLLVGVVVAAAFAAASVAVGGPAGSALVALALVLPLVLVQDGWRYVFIVRRPAAALTIDLVWLCLSCLAIVLVPDGVDVGWYVVAWGIGGIAGAVLGSILGRLQLRWVHPWSYISQNRGLGFRFMGEFITSQAAFYVALLSCGWILGLSAYGAVRWRVPVHRTAPDARGGGGHVRAPRGADGSRPTGQGHAAGRRCRCSRVRRDGGVDARRCLAPRLDRRGTDRCDLAGGTGRHPATRGDHDRHDDRALRARRGARRSTAPRGSPRAFVPSPSSSAVRSPACSWPT